MRWPLSFRVVDYNRHFYALAALAVVVDGAAFWWTDVSLLRALAAVGVATALWFIGVSLFAVAWIYDLSDLYRFRWWPKRAVPSGARQGAIVHAGVEFVHEGLRSSCRDVEFRHLDLFAEGVTTERSIKRARERRGEDAGAAAVVIGSRWPADDASLDVVVAVNALHELRTSESRTGAFAEIGRVLRDRGRLVVVEQTRGLANFVCFGPAALHFWSARTWREEIARAGLTLVDEFSISPFVRGFVVGKTRES